MVKRSCRSCGRSTITISGYCCSCQKQKCKPCPKCGILILVESTLCNKCNCKRIERNKKISQGKKGGLNPMKQFEVAKRNGIAHLGNHPSKETLEKLRGPNSHTWRGGTKYVSYTSDWLEISKREIERAGGICCWPRCSDRALLTHHINGHPSDNRRVNLLPLCWSHHSHITSQPDHSEQHELECIQIQIDRGINLQC
jgi:hypothetical protein